MAEGFARSILIRSARSIAFKNGSDNCRGSSTSSIFLASCQRRVSNRGRLRAPLSTSCFIGEPLASSALQSDLGSLHIIDAQLLDEFEKRGGYAKPAPELLPQVLDEIMESALVG